MTPANDSNCRSLISVVISAVQQVMHRWGLPPCANTVSLTLNLQLTLITIMTVTVVVTVVVTVTVTFHHPRQCLTVTTLSPSQYC